MNIIEECEFCEMIFHLTFSLPGAVTDPIPRPSLLPSCVRYAAEMFRADIFQIYCLNSEFSFLRINLDCLFPLS